MASRTSVPRSAASKKEFPNTISAMMTSVLAISFTVVFVSGSRVACRVGCAEQRQSLAERDNISSIPSTAKAPDLDSKHRIPCHFPPACQGRASHCQVSRAAAQSTAFDGKLPHCEAGFEVDNDAIGAEHECASARSDFCAEIVMPPKPNAMRAKGQP
jgi:hypothetical protein